MTRPLDGVPNLSPQRSALLLVGPDQVANVDLAGAAQTVVPAAGHRYVVFSSTGNFAVDWADGATATFPAGNNPAPGVGAEINPAARYIGDRFDAANFPSGPGFSVIGDGNAGQVTIAFYT